MAAVGTEREEAGTELEGGMQRAAAHQFAASAVQRTVMPSQKAATR